jgi:hypothetical protein|uniref:Uncharacterized protein n=1 Tax=Picea glauca TaxID=3330 RepID=A0A101LXJ8_PICGL|nr:hypothetical protein ABT39_MTgene6012 [Picea glauca]
MKLTKRNEHLRRKDHMRIMKNRKIGLLERLVPVESHGATRLYYIGNGTLCKVSPRNMSDHSLITYTTPNIGLHFPAEMEYYYRIFCPLYIQNNPRKT